MNIKKLFMYSGILLAAVFAVFLTAGTARAQMMERYDTNGWYGPMMGSWTYSDATSSELYATGTEASGTLPERQYVCNFRNWSIPDGNNFRYMPMMGYYGGYGYGPMMGYGYSGFWGWILMILFWVVVAFAVVAVIRLLRHGGRRRWRHFDDPALDILKERYAKGEIDKKEFEEKKKDLES